MSTVVHKKKESNYLRSVADIISFDVTNSSISHVTVTGVRLTRDSSHLYVYVTFEGSERKSLETLNSIKGFIRSRLASGSRQRKVPQLHFELDKTFQEGKRIDDILASLKNKTSE